jgi:hypothetical protein
MVCNLRFENQAPHLLTLVGKARCAVSVAERSARRRNCTGEMFRREWFVPPCASLRAGTAQRAIPTKYEAKTP